jgi:hypothetical protein
MDCETRYTPDLVDPAQVAEGRALVVDYSAAARAHVEALEARLPLEVLAQVLDLANQTFSDGVDVVVARSSDELRAIIDHFPGLRPALQVVADHVGVLTAPCVRERAEGELCALLQGDAVPKEGV